MKSRFRHVYKSFEFSEGSAPIHTRQSDKSERAEVEICTDWALLHKVSHKRLREALQNLGLNPAQIEMYYGQGLTQREIATALMTKPYSVSRRLNRGKIGIVTIIVRIFLAIESRKCDKTS